jgi:hypothetical protein
VRAHAERLVRVGGALAAAAVGLQTAIHLLDAAALERWQPLNANAEGSLFTWASSAATTAAGFAALVCAVVSRGRTRLLVALAAAALFLSADDALAIHERAGLAAAEALGLSATYDSVLWPFLYGPLLAFMLGALLLLIRGSLAPVRRCVQVGLGLLVVAVVAEAGSAPASDPQDSGSWAHTFEGAVEEGAELGGWILLAFGLAALSFTCVQTRPDARAALPRLVPVSSEGRQAAQQAESQQAEPPGSPTSSSTV